MLQGSVRLYGICHRIPILSAIRLPKMGNLFSARMCQCGVPRNYTAIQQNGAHYGTGANTGDTPAESHPDNEFRQLTDADWKQRLTQEQFKVCRKKGTEPAFTGEYVNNKREGMYNCVACGAPVFESKTKYNSGSGWPSFYQQYKEEGEGSKAVITKTDNTMGMARTEVLCGQCESHLGHVFPDGPAPTGMRYCINSVSLKFAPDKKGKM